MPNMVYSIMHIHNKTMPWGMQLASIFGDCPKPSQKWEGYGRKGIRPVRNGG